MTFLTPSLEHTLFTVPTGTPNDFEIVANVAFSRRIRSRPFRRAGGRRFMRVLLRQP
jgi:hypothetical protein